MSLDSSPERGPSSEEEINIGEITDLGAVTASQALDDVYIKDIQPPAISKVTKLAIAQDLAYGLWFLLGGVITVHMLAIALFSHTLTRPLAALPDSVTETSTLPTGGNPSEDPGSSNPSEDPGSSNPSEDPGSSNPSEELDEISNISITKVNRATSLVSETAKTIYTFLTPLVTAVTAFFFREGDKR